MTDNSTRPRYEDSSVVDNVGTPPSSSNHVQYIDPTPQPPLPASSSLHAPVSTSASTMQQLPSQHSTALIPCGDATVTQQIQSEWANQSLRGPHTTSMSPFSALGPVHVVSYGSTPWSNVSPMHRPSPSRSLHSPTAVGSPTMKKILSLDGGGVRGLSIILILKHIMASLNKKRKIALEPWQEFDMIGGTCTGG